MSTITPAMQAWADIKQAHRTGSIVEAYAIGIETKSIGTAKLDCIKLDFNGVYGYMPKNLVDDYNLRGMQGFLDRTLEFVVDNVIIDPHSTIGIFVANRVKALEKKASTFWKEGQEDSVYEAFIRGVDRLHLYLLVEGIPCQIAKRDVGYMYIEDLTEYYEMGDSIDVKVTSIKRPTENTKGKIEVDSKVMQEDPWHNIVNYQVGGNYVGQITRIHPAHGFFVEIIDSPGLQVRTNFPAYTGKKIYEVGDRIRIRIQSIDVEGRTIKAVAYVVKSNKKSSPLRTKSYVK